MLTLKSLLKNLEKNKDKLDETKPIIVIKDRKNYHKIAVRFLNFEDGYVIFEL